jgi:malonyl-CoA/methylmalonyl-CoA synthetase
VVVPETTDGACEDSIIRACKAELANFKVPKRVLFVNLLPRNTMAKVQKNLLRDTYRDLFTR